MRIRDDERRFIVPFLRPGVDYSGAPVSASSELTGGSWVAVPDIGCAPLSPSGSYFHQVVSRIVRSLERFIPSGLPFVSRMIIARAPAICPTTNRYGLPSTE